ncbi:MAG: hypothetical protein GXO65_04120 [Euryarchaeota archaeon]|nr:hypothetical protein [Euryarchaeota archaeon]
MTEKRNLLPDLVVPAAFLCGLITEYFVFRFELALMFLGFQANTGFYIMLALFLLSPFVVTGGIIYYFKKDIMLALIASAAVIPVYLYLTADFIG